MTTSTSAQESRGDKELLVITPLSAHRSARGNLVLTDKFLAGMKAYAGRWPGNVTALVRVREHPDSNLDHVEVVNGEWPFSVEEMPQRHHDVARRMQQAAVVLGGPRGVKGVCQVVVRETSLRTKIQIIGAAAPNPLRRAKRVLDASFWELSERRALRRLAGVQCNGLPTYRTYSALNDRALLFFDNRIEERDLAPADAMQARMKRIISGGTLRLAFTGRLAKIKGVDMLPAVANELRERGVQFRLDICGGGECEESLARAIRSMELGEHVRLRGVLPYRRELLPFVRKSVDLFVCPHVQGDPSCTYIETLACGVPIVGYDNEAWSGLSQMSRAGWATPMRDPKALAARIAELSQDRARIVDASNAARRFASEHVFERTMDKRVAHLLSCLSESETPVDVAGEVACS